MPVTGIPATTVDPVASLVAALTTATNTSLQKANNLSDLTAAATARVNLGVLLSPVTVTASATATLNGLHLVDTTDGAVTLTIPSGTSGSDRVAVLKTNIQQYNVTLSGSVDVTTTRVLRSPNSYWVGQWDGSVWRTVAGDTGYLGGSNYGASSQNATVLRKWAKALANVRTGTASAKILCVGDSTTIGAGTSTTHEWEASWPTVLAELMNRHVAPTIIGLGAPCSSLAGGGTVDDRWTIGTGWANAGSSSNLGWGGTGCLTAADNTASTLIYTPRVIADTFDVYWLRSSSTGTFSIQATGGSTTNISAGGSTGVVVTTVTAPTAASSNAVTVTPTGSGPVFIVGVDSYLSAVSCVRVGNPGQDGSQAHGWINSVSLGGVPCIRAYAPDLTFINLGINDGGAHAGTVNFTTWIQTLITAAKVSGDVIVCGISPTNTANGNDPYRDSYLPILRSLAEINSCGYLSVQDRLGRHDDANTLGIMAGDGLHPNALGHADIAQMMLRAINI